MRKYLLKQKVHKCYRKEIFTLKCFNETHGQTAGKMKIFLIQKLSFPKTKHFQSHMLHTFLAS